MLLGEILYTLYLDGVHSKLTLSTYVPFIYHDLYIALVSKCTKN